MFHNLFEINQIVISLRLFEYIGDTDGVFGGQKLSLDELEK